MKKFKVEYNENGWFRIVCFMDDQEVAGEWTSYQGVAILNLEATYLAVGEYHASTDYTAKFKANVVYKIEGQVMA